MSEFKRVFKLFYIFDLHKEEEWLNEMASNGLHFQDVKWMFIYKFKKGPCEDAIYRIDFNEKINDPEEYYKLYRECNFKYISKIRYFNYFKYIGNKENYDGSLLYNNPLEELKWLIKYRKFVFVAFLIEVIALINTILVIGSGISNLISFIYVGIILTISILILSLLTKFTLAINRLKDIVSKIEESEYY